VNDFIGQRGTQGSPLAEVVGGRYAVQADRATRIYCDHAAGLIPGSALADDRRKALASMTDRVVDVKHLITRQVLLHSAVPATAAAAAWAADNGERPDPARVAKTKIATRRQLDLALAHGIAPFAQYSLSTIAASVHPWGPAVVEYIRDLATTHKASREKAYKMSAWKLVADFDADPAHLRGMPTATTASEAATVRIIERWEAADWKEAHKPHQPAAAIVLTRAVDVERKHVDWLWTTEDIDPMICPVSGALIPLHGLTLIGGREQAAKSTFLWWLAARITRGLLPGHYFGCPRDVVIFATEMTEIAIRLRLEAAGADLSRVHFAAKVTKDDGTSLPISTKDDIELLSAMLESIEPAAVFFDPLKDFLGGINTDREDEVRPALVPLLDLTAAHDCAVIGLIHLVKSVKGDFLARLAGSGAFKNVARAVFGVAHDETTDTRVLQQKKNNDAELACGAFSARVIGVEVTVGGRTKKVGRWVMDGNSPHSLDTVLAMQEQGGKPPTEAERAEAFLLDHLGDGKPHLYEEIWKAADKLKISESTLKRARVKIGATSTREKVRGAPTVWQLPIDDDDRTPSPNGAQAPAPTAASRVNTLGDLN
jgi:hypothetical protein